MTGDATTLDNESVFGLFDTGLLLGCNAIR